MREITLLAITLLLLLLRAAAAVGRAHHPHEESEEEEDAPYVVYDNGATSERNLPLCAGPREACNIIRKRFWLSPIIYRKCKCPDRTVCSTEFSSTFDKRTISFNVRAQLKFCSRVGELHLCKPKDIASDVTRDGMIHVHCFCGPGHFYKQLFQNATGQYFRCQQYASCQVGDFCGNIVVNSYETYHSCTCPLQHICILKDRNKMPVEEFLFKGEAYKGICIPRR